MFVEKICEDWLSVEMWQQNLTIHKLMKHFYIDFKIDTGKILITRYYTLNVMTHKYILRKTFNYA